METDPHRWIEATRRSHDRLVSIVQPLSLQDLEGPSYHDWSIAQVLSHLGSQAELFMGWITAAVERTDPPGRESMQPVWDAWNARSPEAQARDSIAYNERLVQQFEALTDDQLARMHLNFFGMELDAVGLLRLRLGEHAVHVWDIAVAFDPHAQVAPEAVTLLIDTLGSMATRAGKPQGTAFRLRVRTTSPDRDLSLRVGDDVELTEEADADVDGELRIPAEAFLRLFYGRLDADHTPQVELTGPISLDNLRKVFPGF